MPPPKAAEPSDAGGSSGMSSGLGGLKKEWKHPFRAQKDFRVDIRKCWRWIITKVMQDNATMGTRPMAALERMNEFKQYFLQDPTGGSNQTKELDEDEFIEVFSPLLQHRMYTEDQLRRWFRDIDVDASEAVSWDEFTSFMIYQASSFGEENHRSREMVPNLTTPQPASVLHKDLVRRLATHSECEYFVSGGYDGLIKLWNPTNVACVKTINNTEVSAAHDSDVKGGTLGTCPVSDLVFNAKGSHLFACATDKSVTAYDMTNFSVWRRYLGRWKMNENNRRSFVGNGLVECTTLLDMQDTPATMDIAAPKGKEVMYLGMQDGTIMAYPTSRTALSPVLQPYFSKKVHGDAITKMRYLPGIDGLMCSSWDKTLTLVNPETGDVITRLDGGVSIRAQATREVVKHNKIAYDFDYNPVMRLVATVACEREVFLWNPNASSPVAVLKGHATLLAAVAFDPVDRQMFSLDQDNTIKVWDLRMYKVCQTLNESQVQTSNSFMSMTALKYDDKRSTLIGASHRLSTWTVRRAFSAFAPTHSGHTESVVSVDYVKSTGTVLTADHNVVMTWDGATGKRSIVFDPNPGEFGRTSCVGMDKNERKLYIAAKDGTTQAFNFRNGQKLREVVGKTTTEPIRALQCASKDWSSKFMCIVSPTEVVVYGEIAGPSGILSPEPDRVIRPRKRNVNFTTAIELPSVVRSSAGMLVLGTNTGQLQLYSPATGHSSAMCSHPMRPKTRHHRKRDEQFAARQAAARAAAANYTAAIDPNAFLTADGARGASREQREQRRTQGKTGPAPAVVPPGIASMSEAEALQQRRSAPLFNLPVEDIVYLPGKDLVVSCLGDSSLYFWDLRHSVCKLAMSSGIQPEECLLCLAAPPALTASQSESFLVASDDMGVVYVRDISRLPNARSDDFRADQVVVLSIFRAHVVPITRLVAVAAPNTVLRVITQAADCVIKQSTFTGRVVGFFGQGARWRIGSPSTYDADPSPASRLTEEDRRLIPVCTTQRTPATAQGGADAVVAPRELNRRSSIAVNPPAALSSLFLTEATAAIPSSTSQPTAASQLDLAVPGPHAVANALPTESGAFEVIAVDRLSSPQLGTRPAQGQPARGGAGRVTGRGADGDDDDTLMHAEQSPSWTLDALRRRAAGPNNARSKVSRRRPTDAASPALEGAIPEDPLAAGAEPAKERGAGGGRLGANSFGQPVRHVLDHIRHGGAPTVGTEATTREETLASKGMRPQLTMHVKRIPGHGVPADLCHDRLEIRPLTPAVVVASATTEHEGARTVVKQRRTRRLEGIAGDVQPPRSMAKSAPPVAAHMMSPMMVASPLAGAGAGPPPRDKLMWLYRENQMESTAISRVAQQTTDAHAALHSAAYNDASMSLDNHVAQAMIHDPRGWINRVATLQTIAPVGAAAERQRPTRHHEGVAAHLRLLPESLLLLAKSPARPQL